MNEHLLLIDDDARLSAMVGTYLRSHGFEVDCVGSLAAGRVRLRDERYDVLLLDLMLPDGDGLDLTRELRADPAAAPAAADADRARRTDGPHRRPGSRRRRLPVQTLPAGRTAGARQGAAASRVAEAGTAEVLSFGRLEINLGARQARLDGRVCDLTSRPFDLLAVLA